MKIRYFVALFAVLILSSSTFASCPAASGIAQVEAILDFCGQVDPAVASQASQLRAVLLQGVPQKEVADALESPSYRQSYQAEWNTLTQMPKSQVIAACSSGLGTGATTPTH